MKPLKGKTFRQDVSESPDLEVHISCVLEEILEDSTDLNAKLN
jgi:hypothetical protein